MNNENNTPLTPISERPDTSSSRGEQSKSWQTALPWFAGGSAFALVAAYAWVFRAHPFGVDPSKWGEFGDYFGGLLNPTISLLTLVVAISVWRLQSTELTETRAALTKQSVRQTFFDLLQQHRELVNQVQLRTNNGFAGKELLDPNYSGRAAFSTVVRVLNVPTASSISSKSMDEWSRDHNFTYASEGSFRSQLLFSCWYEGENCGFGDIDHMNDFFPMSLEMSFGHVFRSIFQTLKFAYSAPGLNARERQDLVNYLRAQMTEDEFVLYALSSLTAIGEKSRAISIVFDFFENRMNTVDWASPMQRLLSGNTENIEFARKLGFEKVS